MIGHQLALQLFRVYLSKVFHNYKLRTIMMMMMMMMMMMIMI